MPRYIVTLPVTGIAYVNNIEADNEDEAIDRAMEICAQEHLETWQTHRQICTGNVLHAEINEATAEIEE